MIQLNGSMSVVINLGPGAYRLPLASATGKSYLCFLLRKLSDEARVNSLTYDEWRRGITVESVLDSSKSDVVLLDRYDMYFGEGTEAIESFAKSGVVLIDFKNGHLPMPCRMCNLTMKEDRLVVS